MSVIGLVNPLAGSVPDDGKDRLRFELAENGYDVADMVDLSVHDADAQLASVIRRAPRLLVVWGGDGTHRTVLNATRMSSTATLLLPGGTKNLLGHHLHGDKKWTSVVKSSRTSGRAVRLPAGRVGEEYFYCALLAGAPALFARAREDLRHGQPGQALVDFGSGLEAAKRLHLSGRIRAPGQTEKPLPACNVMAALVGPLSRQPGFEISALSQAPSASLDLLWASMNSTWTDIASAQTNFATSFLTEAGGEAIPLVADGEPLSPQTSITGEWVADAAVSISTNSP